MRKAPLIAISTAIFICAATSLGAQAPSAPAPSSQSSGAPPQSAAAAPPSTVKVQTRLITVDIVATDSHGNLVRDLTASDFQVFDERSGQQKIAHLEFIDTSLAPAAALPGSLPTGPHIYSNLEAARFKVPPTVILLDALNTSIFRQVQVRRDMILFLKSLPADTPVAVFLLGHELHVIQNFTTDPKLLRAAVDQARRPDDLIAQNPQDDANSASMQMENNLPDTPTNVLQSIEDFEKESYMEQMDQRVDETADAMRAIAKYLSGYQGRKNLVWFSESFPIWIQPTSDFGGDAFMGSTTYTAKVREAADALTDARVAVYPVDARALEGLTAYSASNDNISTPAQPGGDIAGAQHRADDLRLDSEATMESIADETGGKTCKNTNDLAGCVQAALDESSSYYELSYYPENLKWDGHFQKITIKTPRHGVKLSYRRGFFAADNAQRANSAQPNQLLQDACMDPLPSTGIGLTVEPVAPQQSNGAPQQNVAAQSSTAAAGGARYLLSISARSLTLGPAEGPRELKLQMAICEYDPKGDRFQFFPHDLSRPVTDSAWQTWQQHGIRNIFDYDAKPENPRLRFAVLDVPSGTTGSVDVPAHPRDFGVLPGVLVPAPSRAAAPAGEVPASQPGLSQGAAANSSAGNSAAPPLLAAPPQQKITTALVFSSNTGQSGKLDWSGAQVTYVGNLGIEVGASAFFDKFLGAKYRCQDGALVPINAPPPSLKNNPSANSSSGAAGIPATSSDAAKLAFFLRSAKGPAALVDITGAAPTYSGDLPVDEHARAFFDQVWQLAHCK
jgi:VWFA-related protein